MSRGDQAGGGAESMRPRTRVLATLAACILAWGASAAAQAPAPGWILVVRIVPNPMPIGRCGGITVEVQDDEGYRRTELSNGGVIDFHKFRYDVDTTNFQWQNGNPVDAVLCTRAGAPPSSVTVTVTLADGLSGSVQLTSIAPGQYAAPVQYAQQGPLRRPGVPPPHATTRTAAATVPAGSTGSTSPGTGQPSSAAPGTTTGSASGGAATSSSSSSAPGAPIAVTTSALTMTGSSTGSSTGTAPTTLPLAQVVTTAALTMTGSALPVAALVVTTDPLSMTGSAPTSTP